MFTIQRATPEQTGIPSSCIMRFMERLESHQIPMHSVLLMHRDRLICESYYAPCGPDTLHRMFSITKSLTAIAIGLLADEGMLSLKDPIVRYFPEKLPAQVHPFIADMTIRDMLMMRTCHEKTTYKLDMEKDWVGSFFTAEPTHPAGMIFHYDTSASHTLCALVEKLTGTDMLSYLKRKLAPLELSAKSFLVKDPFGVSLGGSGLVATSMDLLKLGVFLSRNGNIDGVQLISPAFLQEAVSCLTATRATASMPFESYGYGMQFWRTADGGYMCYGMGGQLLIIQPKQELICVTTADTQGVGGGIQHIFDALSEDILPFIGTAEPDSLAPDDTYADFIHSRRICIPSGRTDCPLSDQVSGRLYRIQNSETYRSVRLDFHTQPDTGITRGQITFEYQNSLHNIVFGMGALETGSLPFYDFYYAASGVWLADDTLYVKVHVIDSAVGSIHFQFSFRGEEMTLFMKKQEESLLSEFNTHLIGRLGA